MENYQVRENLRNQIMSFWKDGRVWTRSETDVHNKLKEIHTKVIEADLLDETKQQSRNIYSVCGWDEKHGYFRNKRLKVETLSEAKLELELCKKELDWKIPTVIIKETYFRKNSPCNGRF